MLIIPLICMVSASVAQAGGDDTSCMEINVGNKALITYQMEPLANPKGGDAFKGSDFIHPLKTPSGFVVTEIQPDDHLHHFGLWWPWKYLEVDGREILCWELQEGDGLVQAQSCTPAPDGFTATSIYIDRKAPGGPRTLIDETVHARVSGIIDVPASGYNLDLEIIHKPAIDEPLTVLKYRYSGFTFRGTSRWNKDTCTVLTSEGKDYDASNFSRARWVRVEGRAEGGQTAGVLLMSHPANHNHPEWLRTWDTQSENGAVFINFNPVQNESWNFEPGKTYARRYRVFVYDGTLSAEQAEALWREYAATAPSDQPAPGHD